MGTNTILFLILNNVLITFAWYGHLSLIALTIMLMSMLQVQQLHWNYGGALLCLVATVYFCFYQ